MTELDVQQLILESLRDLANKQEKLHDKLDELNVNYALQSRDISQIKVDLAQHIEGTIQNRQRIEVLEKHDGEQALRIYESIEKIKDDVRPVIEYVNNKKEFPKKLMAHTTFISKILAALTAIGAIGTGTIKLAIWVISHFKF
jgi:hypothetical protein